MFFAITRRLLILLLLLILMLFQRWFLVFVARTRRTTWFFSLFLCRFRFLRLIRRRPLWLFLRFLVLVVARLARAARAGFSRFLIRRWRRSLNGFLLRRRRRLLLFRFRFIVVVVARIRTRARFFLLSRRFRLLLLLLSRLHLRYGLRFFAGAECSSSLDSLPLSLERDFAGFLLFANLLCANGIVCIINGFLCDGTGACGCDFSFSSSSLELVELPESLAVFLAGSVFFGWTDGFMDADCGFFICFSSSLHSLLLSLDLAGFLFDDGGGAWTDFFCDDCAGFCCFRYRSCI